MPTQLDASLIGQTNPIAIPDQSGMLLKAIQAQGLIGQNTIQGLQIEQAQRANDEAGRITQILSDPATAGLDPAALRQKLITGGGATGVTLAGKMLDTQKTQGEIGKTQTEIDAAHIKEASSAIGAAAPNGPTAVSAAIDSTSLPADRKAQLKAAIPTDPTQYAAWTKQQQYAAMSPDQQRQADALKFFPTENGIAAARPDGSGGFMVSNVSGAASYPNGTPGVGPGISGAAGGSTSLPPTINQPFVGAQPTGAFAGDPATLLAGLQRISDPTVRAQAIRALQNQLAGANPTPDASGVNQGQGAQAPVALGGGFAPQTANPLVSAAATAAPLALGAKTPDYDYYTDPTTNQRMGIAKRPNPDGTPPKPFVVGADDTGAAPVFKPSTADQALIDQIGQGKIAFPSSNSRLPHQEQILAEVARQYPQATAADYPTMLAAQKSFAPGGSNGKVVRYLGVASDHLDTLSQAVAALDGGQLPLVNKLVNAFGYNTGSTAASTFDALKEIVGDEVVKAVVGGAGGMGDRQAIKETLAAQKTPQQLANIIQGYRSLMSAQLDAQKQDYEQSTKRTDFDTRFSYGKKAAPSLTVPPTDPALQAAYAKYGL